MPRHMLGIAAALFALPLAGAGAQAPLVDRPGITVTAFEYGTVASQINNDDRTRRRMERSGVRDAAVFAEALGLGAADLVVEKLVASDRKSVV